MEMNLNDKLLYLIRMGVGNEDVRSVLFSADEWRALFALAQEQAVLGIALKGIEKLPEESRPPHEILLKWIACVERIKRQSRKVDEALVALVQELKAIGVEPLVVKGQVVALEYGEAKEWRMSGDIDAFVVHEQWARLEEWIREKGLAVTAHAAEKHIEIHYHGATVELHHHLKVFASKSANRYWREHIEDVRLGETSRCAHWNEVVISGCPVKTLGVTESLVHLIVHAHSHLLTEGVGLRQLTDISLFMRNHADGLDISVLHRHFRGIGFYNAFCVYLALMHKYWGLPKEKLPLLQDGQEDGDILSANDYAYSDKIMADVWRGGNFGHKNNLKGVSPGILHSLNTARLVFLHSARYYALTPAECRGYWLKKIGWRMKRKT